MFLLLAVPALLAGASVAQQAQSTSICDNYTSILLKTNNATTQYTLLTLLVNTALIGNYTQPNVGVKVNGILNAGMYNGTQVNLLPYFDGSLKNSNRGGATGVSVNFLDDGGAAPLKSNLPSNGNQTSNQYMLLTHLYEYFGALLGCSHMGEPGFSNFTGHSSMGAVHKFMDLNPTQLGYFIAQVGAAAASFGVSSADVGAVGAALSNAFGYRCAPPATILPAAPAEIQSICLDGSCPLAPNPDCALYGTVAAPMPANNASASSAAAAGSGYAAGVAPSGTATGGAPQAPTANSAAGMLVAALDYVVAALVVAAAL